MIMNKKCPKCNREYNSAPAISREDNETEICPMCGHTEAFMDFIKHSNELTEEQKKEMLEVITIKLEEAYKTYEK